MCARGSEEVCCSQKIQTGLLYNAAVRDKPFFASVMHLVSAVYPQAASVSAAELPQRQPCFVCGVGERQAALICTLAGEAQPVTGTFFSPPPPFPSAGPHQG